MRRISRKYRLLLALLIIGSVYGYRALTENVQMVDEMLDEPVQSVDPDLELGSTGDYSLTRAGWFVIGHEVSSFRECGAEETEAKWLVDNTGLVSSLFKESQAGADPYSEAFGIADIRYEEAPEDGFGADYAGTAVLTDLQYWRIEGFDCGFKWNDYRFIAAGNEPFWRLVVEDSTVRLIEPESEWSLEANVHEWPIVSRDEALTVTAYPEECRDSMVGNYYSHTVTVTHAGRSLTGCGHRGLR